VALSQADRPPLSTAARLEPRTWALCHREAIEAPGNGRSRERLIDRYTATFQSGLTRAFGPLRVTNVPTAPLGTSALRPLSSDHVQKT
jgi:hypothetical protein